MKKLIAVLLAALMSLALFAVSASADTVVGDPNGVESFDDTENGQDINVQVNKVTHMYAVDLTFNFSSLTIGDIVWDVNTMNYTTTSTLENTTQKIQVDNRSDLPVYAYASVSNDADDGVDVAVTTYNTSASRLTIEKATVGTGLVSGTKTTQYLDVTINSSNWAEVVNYYAKQMIDNDTINTATTYKLATITVTISKSAS